MDIVLGPGAQTISREVLGLYARHPREREILDESGMEWTFIQVGRPPLAKRVSRKSRGEFYSVIFHSQDGRHRAGDLPKDCGLGDATDEELLSLIRGAG